MALEDQPERARRRTHFKRRGLFEREAAIARVLRRSQLADDLATRTAPTSKRRAAENTSDRVLTFKKPAAFEVAAPPGALGLIFESHGPRVTALRSWSPLSGRVAVGDVLVGVTAVRYIGGEYLGKARPERDIFPAGQMDFDTVVDAISSNEEPELSELRVVPHSSDVILRMRKA